MDYFELFKALTGLLLVLGLMAGCAWVARRYGLDKMAGAGVKAGKRLEVVESLALDVRRRLVLIRRDDVEHLVLLGPASETVVERDIVRNEIESSDGNDSV